MSNWVDMNNVMIITGTRTGIGRHLAEYYLEKGWKVHGCSRKPSDLSHESYSHYCLDVSDEKAVMSMVRDCFQTEKRLDCLINNAGIAAMNHSMLTPMSTVERVFRTNVMGSFLFSREVAKYMKRGSAGRIVNFTTVAVPLDLEGESVYAASKAAVEKLTRILAREFAPMNITVNAVGPSPIPTHLIQGVPEKKLESLLKRQVIRRYGTFSDVSHVIDFFIDPEAGAVTGQTIYLGGV